MLGFLERGRTRRDAGEFRLHLLMLLHLLRGVRAPPHAFVKTTQLIVNGGMLRLELHHGLELRDASLVLPQFLMR